MQMESARAYVIGRTIRPPCKGSAYCPPAPSWRSPFAAVMAAEMGAEVIHIERPGKGEDWRVAEFPIEAPNGDLVASSWLQDHRNMYHTTLDFSTTEGREIFLKLVERADIWMESSKARTYDKWGLDDSTVLAANPSLVICHISGYGQDGDPEYVGRASYDFTAQAFGGMMNLMGNPEPDPPTRAVPWTADYITGPVLYVVVAGRIYSTRNAPEKARSSTWLSSRRSIASCPALWSPTTSWDWYARGPVTRPGNAQPWDTFQPRTVGLSSPP